MRFAYYALVWFALAGAAYLAWQIFIPLVGGALLALLLAPGVHRFQKWGLGHGTAVLATLTSACVVLALAALLVVPAFVEQVQELVAQREAMLQSGQKILDALDHWFSGHWGHERRDLALEWGMDKGKTLLIAVGTEIPHLAMSVISLAGNLMLSPLIALFLLWEGEGIRKALLRMVPNRMFELAALLLEDAQRLVGAYLRGQALDCLIVGVLLWAGLALLGLKGSLAIGLLSGLLNAVPYVGPVIGLCLAYLGFMADPTMSVHWAWIGVVFILVMKLDGYLIYPQTVGRSLRMDTFLVLLSLMAGGTVGGIVGMVVATPLLALFIEWMGLLRAQLRSSRVI